MTNMGGRFESHLREIALECLFSELKGKLGQKNALEDLHHLADANGTREKVNLAANYEEKVIAATRYIHGQRTIDKNIIKALEGVASQEHLLELESNIGRAGTLVARRVWGIFFSEKNREKWIRYLSRKYEINEEEARFIMARVCYLPASKRKPEDTYWTLSGENLVHTEFGNHQEDVRHMAEEEGFDITDYYESIRNEFPPKVLEGLNKVEDFRRGYELNPELVRILKEVGIPDNFGLNGLTPKEWQDYGAVRKTQEEFKEAYEKFRDHMLDLFSEVS